jgi:hypothetical protein
MAVLALMTVAQPASRPHDDGVGWDLVSAELDVRVAPDSSLTLAGTIRLALAAASSRGPALVLGGQGIAFDSVRGPAGARIVLTAERDTAQIGLGAAVGRSAEVTVRVWWRAPSRVGRAIAVGRDGAIASWSGLWYPVPAWPADGQPSPLVSGTIRITVPADWRTLSNGTLVDSTLAAGLRIETWRSARAVARSFIAGPYEVRWHRVGETSVGTYLLPRHADRSGEYAAAIPLFVQILEGRFGPYPFESFAIAELPRSLAPPGFGGRSEQGYFIAHTDALEGPGVNVALFAHELAHMWFPNLVDSRPPGDDMIDEAIANYAVALVREATEGDSAAVAELVEGHPDFSARGYFHHVRLGIDEPLMADYSPLIARAKGPLVYRMLRERVGDQAFFETIQAFARQYARRSASLAELRLAFLKAVPHDTGLADFFHQWLDRPGAPILDVTWEEARAAARRKVRARVAQRGDRYRLPLDLVVDGTEGSVHHVVQIGDSAQSFVFDSPGAPTGVRIDPDHKLLLWRAEFGPPPGAQDTWRMERWRAWLADHARWLMRRYDVGTVTVAVAEAGHIAWTIHEGDGPVAAPQGLDQELLQRLRSSARLDTLEVAWQDGAEEVLLFTGIPATEQGSLIVARGGWGGRQLALNMAQEIAIRYHWARIPR